MTHKKYVVVLLVGVVSILLATSLVNVLVDPYDIFGSNRYAGFNSTKPFAGNRVRVAKPYQLARTKPTTLIAGNSRPELGIDPESACWRLGDAPIFNAGLPGIGVFHQARMIQAAMRSGSLKTVLWGVDFLDFLSSRHAPSDGWPTAPEKPNLRLPIEASGESNAELATQRLRDMRDATLSKTALADSLATILMQRVSNSVTREENGFNPAFDYFKIVNSEGQSVLFAQKNREIVRRLKPQNLAIFDSSMHTSEAFESVQFVLGLAAEADVELILFINPYHAEYLTAIDLTKKWSLLEEWKLRLVQIVSGHDNARLFDFNAFDQYSMTQPPLPGVKGQALEWYWEPAHYRKEFGDLMLVAMLGSSCGESSVPAVGTKLTSQNVASHLRRLREGKADYVQRFPERVEALSRHGSDHTAD